MARLLENQAKQLLKEASSMAAGDVEGFASVAFPLVRRVFGGLLANDLVSVQPMSLPAGLIFFLDFTYESTRLGLDAGESIYGGGVVGKAIQTGVTDLTETGGGFYNLQSGYSLPSGTVSLTTTLRTSGSVSAGGVFTGLTPSAADTGASADYNIARLLKFDPDLTTGAKVAIVTAPIHELTAGGVEFNDDSLVDIVPTDGGSSRPH
jgi:hypothetical protein